MFIVLARYRTTAEQAPAVTALLLPLAEASRAEPGNVSYEVLVNVDDPYAFAIVERYADRAAFDAHLASAHYADIAVARIRPLLTERTVDFWSDLPPP